MRDCSSYRQILCALSFVALGFFSSQVFAEPFLPKISTPKNFTDVLAGLEELRKNIDTVQCGGWAPETGASVNGVKVTGTVPLPIIGEHIPGRANAPDQALQRPETGLGERGDFQFPDSAFGYLSACNTGEKSVTDTDLSKPLFDGNGNQLRPAIDVKWRGDFETIDAQITFEVVLNGKGEIDTNPGQWCRLTEKATPRWCEKLFKTWEELSQFMTVNNLRRTNPDCPLPPKEFCFDAPHTKTCTGQECRTPNPPDFWNKSSECHYEIVDGAPILIPDVTGIQKSSPSSFYRHYGSFGTWPTNGPPEQPPLTVTAPGGSWNLRGECYEYYKEEDPKDTVTGGGQCEIIIRNDDEQKPKKPEWEDTDQGKQKGRRKTSEDVLRELPREDRQVPEPWVADASTNLSILDIVKLRELQRGTLDPNDIIGSLGMILPVKQRASKSVPDGTHTDMFDDTAERTASSFWEAQQRELLEIMELPTLRLVMPPKSLIGLASDDPLLRLALHTTTRSDGIVELTLRAGLDDLGSIIESLRRLPIAPIEEVRLPILLPGISDSELDRRIFEWEQWKILEDLDANAKNRESYASSADQMIARLKSYRTHLQDVRKLSGVLATTVQTLLEPQAQIRAKMSEWYASAAQMLKGAAERNEQREEVRKKWRKIQEILLSADACQLDWCSNQRFSLPVYSFLDLWWGDQPAGSPRNKSFTPRDWEKKDRLKHDLRDLTSLQKVKDYEFDFSHMTFPRKPLLVPVLWPIEAPVKIPLPPLVGSKPDDLAYPPLPQLPDANVFAAFPKLRVDIPTLPSFSPPAPPDLKEVIRILGEFEELFGSMAQRYCAIPKALTTPPDKDQKEGKASKLLFVENDLKEVIGREFSRWLPNAQEDMAARTVRLRKNFTALSECHEDLFCWLLPDELETTLALQWFMPDLDVSFTTAAEELRYMSLPSSEKKNPYKETLPVLDRLFPRLEQPINIDLFVPRILPQQ